MSSSNDTRTLIELMYKKFPKCPVCDHDSAYDFSWEANETYARCRICNTRWLLSSRERELIVSKTPAKIRLQEHIFTILGLTLLSAGIFTAFLLNIPLGILFAMGGIVMAMIGVALPPRKKIKREKQEKEPEKTHPCPQCNKKITKNFKICPYCRFNLKTRLGTSVCPSCSRKVSSRFKLCLYCGKKLKKIT